MAREMHEQLFTETFNFTVFQFGLILFNFFFKIVRIKSKIGFKNLFRNN